MKLLIALLSIVLVSCTDATRGYFSSYGEEQDVVCYSGGEAVFNAKTTGKVGSLEGGGWAFVTKDGLYVQTFADCFVSFKN